MSDIHTLCVVWTRPRHPVPAELRTLLEAKPGVQLQTTDGPYDALARVLCQARADDRRVEAAAPDQATGEPPRRTPIVLLMVEPSDLDLSACTFDAAQRFAPHASCWQYDERQTPAMRPVTEADAQTWASAAPDPRDSSRYVAGFVPGSATRAVPARSPVPG